MRSSVTDYKMSLQKKSRGNLGFQRKGTGDDSTPSDTGQRVEESLERGRKSRVYRSRRDD